MVAAESLLLPDAYALVDFQDHGCDDRGQGRDLIESCLCVLEFEAHNKRLVCHDGSSKYDLRGLSALDLLLDDPGGNMRLGRGLAHVLVASPCVVRGLPVCWELVKSPVECGLLVSKVRLVYNNYGRNAL